MEEQFKDIEKLVKEAGLDTPSPDFMQNVMRQVAISEPQESFAYQPLISKKSWFIIGLIALGVLVIFAFFPSSKESIFSMNNFSFFGSINLKNPFSGFVLPKTTTYGVLFLGILFLVQITLLKKRIDKNYSV